MDAAKRHAATTRMLKEKRTPGLINVDIPGLDLDVPVLGPVLDPIINVGPQTTPAPSPTANPPATTPAPATTKQSGGGGNTGGGGGGGGDGATTTRGSGGGNSGGSGGNSGGGGGDNNGGGNDGNTGGGGSNNGGSGGNTGGSGGNTGGNTGGDGSNSGENGGGTGGTNTGGGNTGNGSTGANGGSGDANPTSGSGGGGTGSDSSSPSGGGGSGSSGGNDGSDGLAPTRSANNLAAATGASSGIDDNDDPSNTSRRGGSATTIIYSNGEPVSTFILDGTDSTGGLIRPTAGTGADGSYPTGTGSDGGDNPSGAMKGGLSGGAIAAIVVCVLLALIALIVFLVRRRYRARRSERYQNWWGFGKFGKSSDDVNWVDVPAGGYRPKSARSSFGTSFDQTFTPPPESVDFSHPVPALPPMAQIHDTHINHGRSAATPSPLLIAFDQEPNSTRRYSAGSDTTSNDPYSQELVIRDNHQLMEAVSTPMSVRPFSPTESWAFPKPPPAAEAERPNSGSSGNSHSVYSQPTQEGHGMAAVTTFIPPVPIINPFNDPAPQQSSMVIELVLRPFQPTLADEMAVNTGDQVRIIQVFDDGWASAEKLAEGGKGRGKFEQGLIPVDCFRQPGQEAFGGRRMSSSPPDAPYSGVAY